MSTRTVLSTTRLSLFTENCFTAHAVSLKHYVPRVACALLATQSHLAHYTDEIIVFNCAALYLTFSLSLFYYLDVVCCTLCPTLYGTSVNVDLFVRIYLIKSHA